ncbi:hypothetical protein [Algoriphagus antarcticus]|uniref:Uncharacterized protein n=1 Tax=Algoriphagus antarcticus TaxID=238540 RepID=A0A3E0D2L0_9BACT|nr:hypothetical protein [Algoriphagus antarcticus]REG76929.1 hypothetical protein C8N25_1489 [Algoriphagus antarcticus]
MAAHYRETIARMLQEYKTGIEVSVSQLPSSIYMDLAWEGLNHDNISAWQDAISQEERTRIDQTISNYINQNNNQNCP